MRRCFQTFDKVRILHLTPSSQTSFTPNATSSLYQPGIHNLPGLKMSNTTIIKKAQQRMYFLTSSGGSTCLRSSCPILQCYYSIESICSLFIHHCQVSIGHQAGKGQTPTNNPDCRENHWFQSALYSGLIHVQS